MTNRIIRVFYPTDTDRGKHDVLIRWELAPGAATYEVRYWARWGSSMPTEYCKTTAEPSLRIDGLVPGTEITYQVTAKKKSQRGTPTDFFRKQITNVVYDIL